MQPQVGDLLIAPPQITDARFRESVILLAHASPEGHWGICLNKNTGTDSQTLFQNVNLGYDLDCDIYWGGPVSPGVLWMLHSDDWSMENTLELDSGWSMTSHKEMFDVLIEDSTPTHWRLFSGFCTWAPGQLEGELQGQLPWRAHNSWLTCTAPGPSWGLNYEDQDLWRSAIALSGHQAVREWIA